MQKLQTIVLARALNYLLKMHQVDVGTLEGKTADFSLQALPVAAGFICQQDLTDLFTTRKNHYSWRFKTAQSWVDLLPQAVFNFEEALFKWTGDIISTGG